jgi:hypothetical protein
MSLHCVEVNHVNWRNRDIPDYFRTIETTYDWVQDKLLAIADWAFTGTREMEGNVPRTLYSTIQDNLAIQSNSVRLLIRLVIISQPALVEEPTWVVFHSLLN